MGSHRSGDLTRPPDVLGGFLVIFLIFFLPFIDVFLGSGLRRGVPSKYSGTQYYRVSSRFCPVSIGLFQPMPFLLGSTSQRGLIFTLLMVISFGLTSPWSASWFVSLYGSPLVVNDIGGWFWGAGGTYFQDLPRPWTTLLWRSSSSGWTLTQPPLGGLLGAMVTLLWIFRGTLIPWIALVQSGGERKTPIRVETLGILAGIGTTGFIWTFVAHTMLGGDGQWYNARLVPDVIFLR